MKLARSFSSLYTPCLRMVHGFHYPRRFSDRALSDRESAHKGGTVTGLDNKETNDQLAPSTAEKSYHSYQPSSNIDEVKDIHILDDPIKIAHSIPGIFYEKDFLPEASREYLYLQSLNIQEKIHIHRNTISTKHRSKDHNLPFYKDYKLLHFEDTPGKKINAQTFVDYGSSGHELTYFMGNQNIPHFIWKELIPHMSNVPPVQLLSTVGELMWRFTLNIYTKDGTTQAGFDWHKDISANGEITSITTVLGDAVFQIRPEDKSRQSSEIYSLCLSPGSIVLLSAHSRWKWEHRVLPQKAGSSSENGISRISLVLGCR